MTDRHLTAMTQMRLHPDIRQAIQKASVDFDIPMNWIVNRALEAGLPHVLHHLGMLHGKVRHNGNGE